MLKSFEEMENGTVFLNSFSHTTCIKISPTRYYDVVLKHCITMRKELKDHPHMTAKLLCTTEE